MNQLLSSFDEYLRLQRRRSPATAKCYVAVATNLIDFLSDAGGDAGGDAGERLSRATADDLEAFLLKSAATKTGKLSAHMWNQKLAALRTLFRFLVKRKLAPGNPAFDVDPSEAEESPKKVPLSLAEFVSFIRAIEMASEPYRSRDIALAQVAFHCALRVSELRRLDFAHFDFQHRLIVNLLVKGQKFLIVPFPAIVADAIQHYLTERDRFHPKEGEPAVFLSERGQRLSIRQIEALIPSYAKRAGILRRVTPHYLRHSVATAHAKRGTKPEDIQLLLGHESFATTKHYIHMMMNTLCTAVDGLGEELERMLADDAEAASAALPRGPRPQTGLSLLTAEGSAASP